MSPDQAGEHGNTFRFERVVDERDLRLFELSITVSALRGGSYKMSVSSRTSDDNGHPLESGRKVVVIEGEDDQRVLEYVIQNMFERRASLESLNLSTGEVDMLLQEHARLVAKVINPELG